MIAVQHQIPAARAHTHQTTDAAFKGAGRLQQGHRLGDGFVRPLPRDQRQIGAVGAVSQASDAVAGVIQQDQPRIGAPDPSGLAFGDGDLQHIAGSQAHHGTGHSIQIFRRNADGIQVKL